MDNSIVGSTVGQTKNLARISLCGTSLAEPNSPQL